MSRRESNDSFTESHSTSSHKSYNIEEWKQIDTWLRHLYPHRIPLFDRTPETFNALLKLQKQNESADNIVHVLLNAQREIQKDNRIRFQNERQILNDLELFINKTSLSRSYSALTTLSSLATILGVDKCHLSSFQTAFANLTIESMESEIEEQLLEESEYALRERIAKLKTKKEHLQNTLEFMREAKQETEDELKETWKSTNMEKKKEIKQQLDLLKQKQKEYDDTKVEQHGLRLNAMKRLVHDTSVIRSELADRQEYLERYKDLPPDMVMASFKTQEAEERLYELRQERERLLADIADSVQ
ncbi:hypothetical protein J3Q64DRAFT_1695000 [Phycomyces blakesleeanus]|uniref:Uncharacterized protein n=2 Tax=Phycomyces blakesleeanus TaxID=4837 RepID=A0A163B6G5_PHYB8|nr:hypothetical protein PHYBLDRAFT_140621 [Phycomyces blakesleeanus NRRL 1555(-)]OAD78551.1 hypothetical protein PHYBLDRAFT_140621 [Phycomyces blakesleeanus NRRL 1555(-)]|eukprot:XP_018296591.1 hypothetical protein PHYBLDRAFT_140621 [Phycomyces blakesleeanus NRRL 1555(-)]